MAVMPGTPSMATMRDMAKDTADNGAIRPAKLFIGGLTRNTTTKQLRDHFAAYGRVLDCVAMRQPDGRPRGFGYVTLDSSAAADRVVAVPQVIDGRMLDMKRAVPEGSMASAPTTRLHTPTGASVSRLGLSESALNAPLYGAWPEAPVSPFGGYYGSATASLYDVPAASWPWSPHAAAAAVAAAAAAAAPLFGTPDCLELLSRARVSPLASRQDLPHPFWSLPQSPTAEAGGLMSALAPEFVPFGVLPTTPQSQVYSSLVEAGSRQRQVLGEITNLPCAKKGLQTAKVAGLQNENAANENAANMLYGMHKEEMSFGKRRAAMKELALQIDTENIDPRKVLTEPAAELSPMFAAPSPALNDANLKGDDDMDEDDGSDEDGDDSEIEVDFTLPLPSMGSADHREGTCKRCNFFPKGRCQNGESCTFCHYPHEKRKPSRQEKRDRRAAWAGQLDDDLDKEQDYVQQTVAYSMLPGLPPMCTTKLPTPLILPGGCSPCGSFAGYGFPSINFPLPPPGLASSDIWQPDEEVSPVRSRTPQSFLSTVPMLSTTPMSANHHLSTALPTVASVQAQMISRSLAVVENANLTPSSAAAGKVMVTMGTQTAAEVETENADALDDASHSEAGRLAGVHERYTRDELLRLRGSALALRTNRPRSDGIDGRAHLRTQSIGTLDA